MDSLLQTEATPFMPDAGYPALLPVEALEREFTLAPGETGVLSFIASIGPPCQK